LRRTFSTALNAYCRIGARRAVKYVSRESQKWDRAHLRECVQRKAGGAPAAMRRRGAKQAAAMHQRENALGVPPSPRLWRASPKLA